jgi:CARDB protein
VSTDVSFEVGVTNSGENQEVGVKVNLTIPAQPTAIKKTGTIDVIDPGETKTVTFADFPDFPFQENTTVQVSVAPVPGETNTGNNTAEYPVVFTLQPS